MRTFSDGAKVVVQLAQDTNELVLLLWRHLWQVVHDCSRRLTSVTVPLVV